MPAKPNLIFRHPSKPSDSNSWQMVNTIIFFKYLGILIVLHLNWEYQFDLLASKLSHEIRMLSKIRHVCKDKLCKIYFGIFSSLLTYRYNIWGQVQIKHIK